MRVLLTTDTVGGVWRFTQELASELLLRGHVVGLLSFGREPSAAQSAACRTLRVRFGETFEYRASTAPLEWMEGNGRAYTEGLPALLAFAGEIQPEIIHVSQFCFGKLPLSTPVVITAHSDVLSWAEACEPEGLSPSAWLDQYVLLVNQGFAHAAAIVAPTRWMCEALSENYRFAFAPRVIFNGIEPQSRSNGIKKAQAVSVGRLWDKGKNILLLTEVDSPIPILVAGEQRFEQTSIVCGTSLTMLGELSQRRIFDLFTESSVYLAPSRYEPFGLAPLEAAQCGCALLLKDLPSFFEIWGDAALYFSDATSLSKLLAELSPQSLLEAQIRSLARARQLTAVRMAAQYESLYSELLSMPSPGPREELVTHAC